MSISTSRALSTLLRSSSSILRAPATTNSNTSRTVTATLKGHHRFFSTSRVMTDSTSNPDGLKVPKPQDAPSEGRKPIPNTGWKGEVPSHKGGDYEKDFLNKPPYQWTSDKFQPKYHA
jgi:hypothetical protein